MADFVDEYLTISKPSEGLFKDRGSKFIAFAYPVSTEEEIKEIQEKLRSDYHDARHHCYAYMLGKDKNVFRANDDGEPSSTAGKPILGQIKSYDLTNILIIVIRYFGGTKLGVSGLINAYKTAADDSIDRRGHNLHRRGGSVQGRLIGSGPYVRSDSDEDNFILEYLRRQIALDNLTDRICRDTVRVRIKTDQHSIIRICGNPGRFDVQLLRVPIGIFRG